MIRASRQEPPGCRALSSAITLSTKTQSRYRNPWSARGVTAPSEKRSLVTCAGPVRKYCHVVRGVKPHVLHGIRVAMTVCRFRALGTKASHLLAGDTSGFDLGFASSRSLNVLFAWHSAPRITTSASIRILPDMLTFISDSGLSLPAALAS